jgi:hypothetical protein
MAQPVSQGGIDYQDGGFSTGQGLYANVSDMAELAVRLGAPSSVDRSGTVVAIEDFRYGLSMIESTTAGLGETVLTSGSYSRYGGYSAKLTRVANVDSYVGTRVRVGSRPAGTWGAEALFTAITGQPNVRLFLVRHTGTHNIGWAARWDGNEGKVYYEVSTGVWEEVISDIPMNYGYPLLHSFKLVVSETDLEYMRIIADGEEVSFSADPYLYLEDTSSPDTLATFFNAVGPAVATVVYADAIIITCNEPAR